MQMPNIRHPKRVQINGAFFEIITYVPITDDQALKIAVMAVRTNAKKFKKGKLYLIPFNLTAENIGLL